MKTALAPIGMLVGGLCVGVALELKYGVGLLGIGTVAFLSVVLGVCFFSSKKRKIFLLLLLTLGVLSGLFRATIAVWVESQETLKSYVGQVVLVEGRVVDDPDKRDRALHLTVQVSRVNSTPGRGEALLFVPRESSVSYGDLVEVKGTLELPSVFETDTGHIFNYPEYLRAHGVSVIIKRGTLLAVRPGGPTLLGPLFFMKHLFESSLERLLPEPDSSLLEGILLGEKHGIPKSLTTTFTESGLVHVVVLSGYNITIVSLAVFSVLSFLPRTAALTSGGLAMVLFALMTGAGSATLRSLTMALIALYAKYLHRPTDALRLLLFALSMMVLWNPVSLLFDPSLVLSVLATFGLVTLSAWVEGWLPKIVKRYETVRTNTAATIAVQLFVFPMLLYYSGILSFFSVPANILALPAVPLTMLFGFIAGCLGLVSQALAFLPALIADLFLKWIMFVADKTANAPFSTLVALPFSAWYLLPVYALLAWFAVRKYKKSQKLVKIST